MADSIWQIKNYDLHGWMESYFGLHNDRLCYAIGFQKFNVVEQERQNK